MAWSTVTGGAGTQGSAVTSLPVTVGAVQVGDLGIVAFTRESASDNFSGDTWITDSHRSLLVHLELRQHRRAVLPGWHRP
jgi:hypothetical protein